MREVLFAASVARAIRSQVMTSYLDALKIIRDHAQGFKLASERVSLDESVGRTTTARIASPWTLPAFDTSAMDGYAIRSSETSDANDAHPLTFKVLGGLAAGDQPSSQSPTERAVWEIMTGAPFPEGYDSCVRQEDVVRVGNEITINKSVPPSNNRRIAGEDFRPGSTVVEKGHRLRAIDLLCFAALGLDEVDVARKLRVSIIATGKELVGARVTPTGAHIRNSTTPFLAQAIKIRGAELVSVAQVGDDPDDFLREIERASSADLILTTGAISVGKYDFVVKALQTLGLEIFFQKVKIRPGKPLLFGRLKDGRFIMGLPGNPVATATGFRFFVDPLLRALQGQPEERPLKLRLAQATKKAAGATSFLKAWYEGDRATAQENQKASMTNPLLQSNGWIALGEDTPEHIDAGVAVDVYPFI